jgi:hypothetical protein
MITLAPLPHLLASHAKVSLKSPSVLSEQLDDLVEMMVVRGFTKGNELGVSKLFLQLLVVRYLKLL